MKLPLALLLALTFFALHITRLAPSLEDIDSVNFALAIDRFDPVEHRPHPPGYPVFVALARLSARVVTPESRALAFWGTLFGALSVFPLARLFSAFEAVRREGSGLGLTPFVVAAVIVTITSPLYWFTAVRPLSDGPGLFVSLLAQAALADAFVRHRAIRGQRERGSSMSDVGASGRLVVLGALLSAVAIGLRAQAAWLTLPLLAMVVLDRIGTDAAGAILGSAMALVVGLLLWMIPMFMVIGDPARYFTALMDQGGEDLTGVQMLATGFTPRLLLLALWQTVVAPWHADALGWTLVALALVGAAEMVARARATLVVLLAIAMPYALFHLVFHETATVRYALPLIPAIAYLALCGARLLLRRWALAAALGIAVASIWITHPAVHAYGASASPVAAALDALAKNADARNRPIGMHHVFARSFAASGLKARALPAPPKREWLELVSRWKNGNLEPVWFLADPKRTDLALIDRKSRRLLQAYRWPFGDDRLLGGARPSEVDLYEIVPPRWFAEQGFALTPETAGIAREMGQGPSLDPIRARVKARADDATLMVGGRHLGGSADAALFRVTSDERELATWKVEPSSFFLKFFQIRGADLGVAGVYAALEIQAVSATGSPSVPDTSIEQFDVQDADVLVFGFGEGWHELEYNPATGALWRWTSERAVVRVRHRADAVRVRVRGESPLRYFDDAPVVVIRAGVREVARYTPTEDFDWTIVVPGPALESSETQIVVETDRTFVPAERSLFRRSADRRRLGLRIYEFSVEAASGAPRP